MDHKAKQRLIGYIAGQLVKHGAFSLKSENSLKEVLKIVGDDLDSFMDKYPGCFAPGYVEEETDASLLN